MPYETEEVTATIDQNQYAMPAAAAWGLYAVAKRIAMGFYPEAASIAGSLSTDSLKMIQEILGMTSDTIATALKDRK